ncbi:MAG: cyclic nucleotide-binding domain-containing protein [Myxococcaceae bacterium]
MADAEAALWTPPSNEKDRQPKAIEALRAVPLFAEMNDGELKKILRLLHQRTYQPNEVVFREGDPAAGMYIIMRGSVNIVARMPDGSERILAQLGERQFFGEMALLEDEPRSASCVALEKTELLGFFEPDLDALVQRDARLGSRILWHLARLMAGRLRAMNETLKAQRQ